jgi:hypothetical protein
MGFVKDLRSAARPDGVAAVFLQLFEVIAAHGTFDKVGFSIDQQLKVVALSRDPDF